ncbi:MAG: hypothetical protein M0R75_08780 [Dehalococcoidia bacterium]|nr:hypothetical protein [Dehalococcoidia bacterium]
MPTRSLASSVLRGALWTSVLTFPLAGLCALVYRFPVPFAGYVSGPDAIPGAVLGVLFYGLVGGVVLTVGAGAIGGAAAYAIARPDRGRIDRLTFGISLALAAMAVLTLAMLDKLIGDW